METGQNWKRSRREEKGRRLKGGMEVSEVKGGIEVRFRAFTTWGPSGLSSKSLLKGDFIFLQPSLRLGQVGLG